MGAIPAASKLNWRQSSSWVHTWLGLLFGWVLFMVFVTGTISVFRDELSVWIQPELLQVTDTENVAGVQNAIEFLEQQGPAAQWIITLPHRSATVSVRWLAPGEPRSKRAGKRAELEPATGQQVTPQPTRFIDFLYRMHFELYNLPRSGARWFIGIATAAMFIALITGVIIHRRIFADFFTFRPRKGQRSCLDLHNAVSVLALPFHLMITFSGLLLLMYLLIPWGIDAAYEGDFQQFRQESGGKGGVSMQEQSLPVAPLLTQNATDPRYIVPALLKGARQRWPAGVSSIQIMDPLGTPSYIFSQQGANSIVTRARSEALRFDGSDGTLVISSPDTQSISATQGVYNVLTAWHLMRFAQPVQRWLYFVGGVAGSLMVASGLVLWSKRREEKYKGALLPANLRWVSVLNLTAIIGLFLSIIAGIWANRVLGGSDQRMVSNDIIVFFSTWSVFFAYAWLRHWVWPNPSRCWQESLWACVITFAALVLFDVGVILPLAMESSVGLAILLSADGVVLLLAVGAWLTLRWLKRYPARKPASRPAKAVAQS